MGHIHLCVLCVREHASLSCPNPSWLLSTYLEDPRLLRVPRHPSPVPFWFPLQGLGWASFFPFSLFSKAQSLPIHEFGPPPTYLKWALNFDFVMFWALIYALWYFRPKHLAPPACGLSIAHAWANETLGLPRLFDYCFYHFRGPLSSYSRILLLHVVL